MTAPSTAPSGIDPGPPPPPPSPPQITVRGQDIPVILPKRTDPRLKLSATIFTLTFLGVSVLSFQLSIPQILVSVLLCALIEVAVTYRRDRVLVWPASAIQTGVSVAFIFRVGGTLVGDLWTVRGLHLFAIVALGCMASKYFLRVGGRHVFNPSNIGLAWGLLLIGPSHVFSEHLWWGPLGAPVLLAMAVIWGGAFWLLRQVRMIPMATAFLGTFFALIALFALFGRSYYALWHDGPVGGSFYWVTIALSPELLIFVFFMITDPQTSPKSPLGRIIFGVTTAVVAAGLIVIQTTEFGIKVAILSSLIATCALARPIDRWAARIVARRDGHVATDAAPARPTEPVGRRLGRAVRNPVLVAVAVIAIAAPLNTVLLVTDDTIELIERGLTAENVQ